MRKEVLKVFVLAGLVGLAACDKKGAVPADTAVQSTVGCANDSRLDATFVGIRKLGLQKTLTFSLVDASPNPAARELNVWHLAISDAEQKPVTGATLTVKPFMPDHGHGASVAPTVTADGNQYIVTNIDFFMAGVWEMTLTAQSAQGADSVVLTYCVDG